MNSKFLKLLALTVVIGLLAGLTMSAQGAPNDPNKDGKKEKQSLYKTAGSPTYAVLDINNLTAWAKYDGLGAFSPSSDNGVYYPRGTGNTVYKDGLVFAGKAYTGNFETSGGVPAYVHPIRVTGGTYGIGTRAGYVTGLGATAVAALPANSEVRIYRIRRDYPNLKNADGTFTTDIRRDAGAVYEVPSTEVTDAQMLAVYQQYETDWNNWPAGNTPPTGLGAPYIERNGRAGYQKPPAFSASFTVDSLISGNYDEPGVAGADPNSPADQVIWTVYNDLTESVALGFASSEGLGLEIQKTMWAYKRSDALGNLFFYKYKFINKGGVDVSATAGVQPGIFYIDSMYVCQWSDIDLGSFSDDLAGCDSVLSMGFVYNGNPVDATYRNFGLAPATSGYDFLGGPIVPQAGDSAVFDLKKRYNYHNLGMSSFAYFSAGSPYSDPPNLVTGGYSGTAGQWWKMLRGFAPIGTLSDPDVPYASGPYPVSPFPLSGDPTTGTGFLDGKGTSFSFVPGDRRILLNSGPFTMAPGDTQEAVVGYVAGLGSDRLSSVTVMKFNDRFVQNTYNALFQVPKPPATPDVKVAEVDGEVSFEWASNVARMNNIETTVSQPGSYVFEGYNVYQLPARTSPKSEWKRIATYDLETDPAVILDQQVDNASGQVLSLPVQFGSNSGISRNFAFSRDYIKDINKVYNGQEYYIVITAYSRATVPGYLPSTLESDPVVYTVRPQSRISGQSAVTKPGDQITVTHPSGIGDVDISVTVVNPLVVTGQTYTISWSAQPDKFYNYTTDGNDPPGWEMTTNAQLNEAANAVSYSVKMTNVQTRPIVSMVFQDSTGATVKALSPVTDIFSNAEATGTWKSTDGTQPLTAGLATQWARGKMSAQVITSLDTTILTQDIVSYPYSFKQGSTTKFSYQQNYSQDNTYPIFDGLQVKVGTPVFSNPSSYTWSQTAGTGDAARFYTGFGYAYADIFPQSNNTTTLNDLVTDLEFRFTGVRATRANGTFPEDTVIVSGGSIATVASSNAATIIRMRIPFELWEVDQGTGRNRQINVVCRDRNADGGSPWGSGGTPLYLRMASAGRAYIGAVSTAYTSDATAAGITAVPRDNPKGTWFFATGVTTGSTPKWRTGDVVHIVIPNKTIPGTDTFSFTAPAAITYSAAQAKADADRVGVFPNPYYAFNAAETNRFVRFVTFNNLPAKAIIRIFNLAGQLVRRLDKDDPSQFLRWDLANSANFPVASGMYIAHLELTFNDGSTTSKVLKFAIIQEQEILNSY